MPPPYTETIINRYLGILGEAISERDYWRAGLLCLELARHLFIYHVEDQQRKQREAARS